VVDAGAAASDGDLLSVAGLDWRVVHTPGHARSHICLHDERARLLISGDHLLGSVTPHIDLGPEGGDPLGDYLASLEATEELAPALVLAGHGRPFDDGAERARATLRHHERRLGAIVQVVRTEARSAAEVADAVFGDALLDFHRRLALGEALAHLVYLERRGEVERIEAGGLYLFKKASRRCTEAPE
jgi:glyoxylase-like metal-dependent hydrolase (beta-lactamase superfamily II)